MYTSHTHDEGNGDIDSTHTHNTTHALDATNHTPHHTPQPHHTPHTTHHTPHTTHHTPQSIVRRMFCRSLLRVRMKKAKKVCLGLLGNLCGAQREFRFLPKERCFQPYERKKKCGHMKVFDGSSISGSGSSFKFLPFQVP